MFKHKMVGEVLIEKGIITEEQLLSALEEQEKSGDKIGSILVKRACLTEQKLMETMELVMGIPNVQISKIDIDTEAGKLVPAQIIRRYKILPLAKKHNSLTLAMVDPLNQKAIDDVRRVTGLDVIPVLANEKEMDIAIRQYLAFRVDPNLERILGELNQDHKENSILREIKGARSDEDAPVIRMVNSLLSQAVQWHCSDVHIEPLEEDVRVRFRVDGELYEVFTLPRASINAIVSRIKIMGNMDIAEKRLPQDGRFNMTIENREVDFRVSTLPTSMGEKVVLRILDKVNTLTHIHDLGLSAGNHQRMMTLAHHPHGMLLVTGPTGSGKTTLLYALLKEINSVSKNTITLEDPIEYTISGINQVQIHPKAGLTFASGLRSILRQDPDVIMVGEIRDRETAALAVQAALTGHLVLSTLHTNSAVGTLARLNDMGIEDFLLASSLVGVVSQRLVRTLCPECRQPYTLDEDIARSLGIPECSQQVFYHASGCRNCGQLGYKGRIAIHEIMLMGPRLRKIVINGNYTEDELTQVAVEEGMISMKQDGLDKALQGLSSLEEVMKVILLGI